MNQNKSFKLNNQFTLLTKNTMFAFIVASVLFSTVMFNSNSFAEPAESQTIITPINDSIGIEKTTMQMFISKDNKLPWGFVEGKISNHVEGYPVIIQIFKENDAVHFAQTDVNSNGNYEYKFRVLNSENGVSSKIFDGDYSVKIFKVVYMYQENLI